MSSPPGASPTPVASIDIDCSYDKTLDAHPALFSIPTHTTTHASSAEYLDASVGESLPTLGLQGRPQPTLTASTDDVGSADQSLRPTHTLTRPNTSATASRRSTVTPAHDSDEVLRNNRPMIKASVHVEETPFPSLVADATGAPPDYHKQLYPNLSSAGENLSSVEGPPPPPLTVAGQQGGGGRFPRWRGWLEKRALERHFERLDAGDVSSQDPDVKRKKSWGAGVDDDDALSDGEEQDENELPAPNNDALHLHAFGSRFISHLPYQPLCSVYLDVPPPATRSANRLLRRSIPEGIKRHVLLIGTANGLYVAEYKRRKKQDVASWTGSQSRRARGDEKKKEGEGSGWNENIRCRQVWSGVGVYQMSILAPKTAEPEQRSSTYGFPLRSQPTQEGGILLALCSTAKHTMKSPVAFMNTQGGSLRDNLNSISSPAATNSKDGSVPSLATSHFAVGGGGGPGRVGPSSGSGTVRMWSLEALRRVVTFAMDAVEPRAIDLLKSPPRPTSGEDGRFKLTARIRKAWASLGDPPSERRTSRASRQAASLGEVSDRGARPSTNEYRSKLSTGSDILQPGPHVHQRSESQVTAASELDEFGQMGYAGDQPEDNAYEECLRLSQSSIAITLPVGPSVLGQQVNLGQGDSYSSLFSEESIATGAASNSGHGASTNSHSSGKGVLFFSVFEAGIEMNGAGTWYIAAATSKSIYLYEAVRPTNKGESRSWAFIREYYTPFTPKGIAFTYSEPGEADGARRSSPSPPLRKQTGHSAQQSIRNQRQVKSSPYSSVFRSHADLTMFVSFGKRAVLIRASDASVKEVDVAGQLEVDSPASASSDTGHGKPQHISHVGHGGHGGSLHKRRSLSIDLLSGEWPSRKDHWIGIERILSQVIIRCKHHTPPNSASMGRSQSEQLKLSQRVFSRFGEDDDDDDDEVPDEQYDGRGVTLQDVPPPPVRTSSHGPIPLLRRGSGAMTAEEPAHVLSAKVALLSRGSTSHVYPLPLPWDTLHQRPLGTFHWSDTPTAVTAWSTVIGLERDLSSGPISILSLGAARKRPVMENMLHLDVQVTALAFLPSRLEMKTTRVKVQVKLPFVFTHDSELELEPIAPQQAREETAAGDDDGEESAGKRLDAHHELEYLCGMLCVAQRGQDTVKPWEAGGDAGAWAFDWRGANDFRLFFVGARA